MKELNALLMAAEAVRIESARLSQLSEAAQAVTVGMVADSRPLDSLALGVAAVHSLRAEAEGMYERFYRAAFDFTGESRFPAESFEEYFFRIASMTTEQTLAAPARNGLRLDLWSKN